MKRYYVLREYVLDRHTATSDGMLLRVAMSPDAGVRSRICDMLNGVDANVYYDQLTATEAALESQIEHSAEISKKLVDAERRADENLKRFKSVQNDLQNVYDAAKDRWTGVALADWIANLEKRNREGDKPRSDGRYVGRLEETIGAMRLKAGKVLIIEHDRPFRLQSIRLLKEIASGQSNTNVDVAPVPAQSLDLKVVEHEVRIKNLESVVFPGVLSRDNKTVI